MKKTSLDKMTLFIIPIGVGVNFIGSTVTHLLKLPMYLDSIGTIVVGALCGPVPGAIVGLVSNILNSITQPMTMFYAILSIMFGILAGFLSKKKVFITLWKTLLSIPLFALIGGGLGFIITWIIYGFDFGAGNSSIIAIPLYEMTQMSKAMAQFIAEFSVDMLDKSVTLVLTFIILGVMPMRLLTKLPQGEVYIKIKEDGNQGEE